MLAKDEVRLDEIYRYCLHIEKDMLLEGKRLEISERIRLEELKEKREIRALRESRRAELLESASGIFEWVSNFTGSPKGEKILSTIGEVLIFRGQYFDGKPRVELEYEAWLSCDRNGLLHYQEFYRGSMGRQRTKVLTNPEQMISRLHPSYILSAGDAIATGMVWNEVACSVGWRAKISDIRRHRGWLVTTQKTRV